MEIFGSKPSVCSAGVALCCLFQLLTTGGFAQQPPTGQVFFQNKSSKGIMTARDVTNNTGLVDPGRQVWQSRLNYSRGQNFYLDRLSDGTYQIYLTTLDRPDGLLVSLKYYLANTTGPTKSTSGSGQYGNYLLLLENEYPPSTVPVSAIGTNLPAYQKWKMVPVPNESNTFRIQSTAFSNSEVVLEASSQESDTPLHLSVYSGKTSQKWVIQSTKVQGTATNVQVSNLTWVPTSGNDRVQGDLRWTDESSNETGFFIKAYRAAPNQPFADDQTFIAGANTQLHRINFEASAEARPGDEYCFQVFAYNKWEAVPSPTSIGCAKAERQPSTPPTGVGAIRVFNCHSNQQPVRVWTYDLTVDNGQWQDRGAIPSQWSGSSCPGNATPLTFTLTDGHNYVLKAIDCGNGTPPQTQGSCHRLTSTNALPGKRGGATLTFTVN